MGFGVLYFVLFQFLTFNLVWFYYLTIARWVLFRACQENGVFRYGEFSDEMSKEIQTYLYDQWLYQNEYI